MLERAEDLQVVTNVGPKIRSNKGTTFLNEVDCDSLEEADGRVILHVKDAVQHGAESVIVRCSDTDVVVLCVSYYHSLNALGLKQFWILYASGKN